MLKTVSLAAAACAMSAAAIVPAAPAAAQSRYDRYARERAYQQRYNDGYGYRDRYDRRGYRYRCRRNDGTTGTIVGAIAGGLLGRTVDTRGDRTAGTLGGAVLGGLAGRAIERSDRPGYCR